MYIAKGSLSVIRYNDNRLWTGGYNISGSKLNLSIHMGFFYFSNR